MTEVDGVVWDYNGVVFEPGDRVRVVRFAETLETGGMGNGVDWDNCWIQGDMDDYIGLDFTIDNIYVEGVEFVETVGGWKYRFPLSVLVKIED